MSLIEYPIIFVKPHLINEFNCFTHLTLLK